VREHGCADLRCRGGTGEQHRRSTREPPPPRTIRPVSESVGATCRAVRGGLARMDCGP
jgi:hypothetical protein